MSIRARKMLKMQFSFWFPAKIECVVYLSTSIHEPQHTLVKSALTILKFDFFLLIQVATHIIITQQFSEFRFAKAKWSNEWMKKEKKMKKKKLQIPFSDEWALTYALFSSLLLSFALFHIHSDDGRNLSLTNCKNRKISNPLNEEKKSLVWLNLCLQWNVEFFPLFLSTL